MDTKNNMAYIITLLVISIIVLIGGAYAYFTASMSSGETEATLRVGAGQLKIKFANTNSVQITENVQPTPAKTECTKQTGAYYCDQSEYFPVGTKTFTLTGTNTTDASKNMKMSYNIKLIIPQNQFSSGALKYTLIGSKEANDNGKVVNIDTWKDIPTGSNTTGTILGSGYFMPGENMIHTYTFNIYFPDNHISQDADKNKIFGAKIEITTDEIKDSVPNGWNSAKDGTLLAAIKRDNELESPITTPGTATSYSINDPFPDWVFNADGYITYGDTYKVNNDGTYTIENPMKVKYSEALNTLKGKYMVSSENTYSDVLSYDDELLETTNKKQLLLIRDTAADGFTYSKISSGMKTFPEETEAVMASTADDYGTSYYFRGAVEINYVEFANKCWRIVRVTGDGSIKLVLFNNNTDGKANPCAEINDNGEAAIAGISQFNYAYNDNAFVGLMYGNIGCSDGTSEDSTMCEDAGGTWTASTSYANAHKNINKSTILKYLEEWYNNNLANYDSYISDTIWCNDKSTVKDTMFNPYAWNNLGTNYGYGLNINYYGTIKRIIENDRLSLAGNPSLICPNDDLGGNLSKYTVSDKTNGNGNLDKKIGLLTADEVVYAGGGDYNKSYYLLKNSENAWWWALSPFEFSGGAANVWDVNGINDGIDIYNPVYEHLSVRPSISLVSNIKISSGNGTRNSPYKVST